MISGNKDLGRYTLYFPLEELLFFLPAEIYKQNFEGKIFGGKFFQTFL